MATNVRSNTSEAAPARSWLDLEPALLLQQCDIDLYRASGPGGQKRNKTSSAVRLRHRPTGLIVTAVESRSQHENRARALGRLRRAIALTQRNPVDPAAAPPDFYAAALQRDPGLHMNTRHEHYCHVIQHILDVLHANRGGVADTAAALKISTGQLVRFLAEDPDLWAHANRIRRDFGHPPLKRP
ncbi:MAG TPA: peptide chain release factor-like protein [Phycisphaerae bacterium]|jgi:hypothetical protein|nr:peptide chain release factor-like protein [Phycisphaerae bacterium]HOB75640.1 peptide chain release factor-like protein [Phycisphaerae bacterium]HOJ56313.1 peptide chain release factor-like protein [Phycisphaerae bacterium]HOL28186.1 peptide chain release factor-like protein [Phycisphaerae bacterium]HPP22460.1 peptide chain release factor-like protein [Phycisphaerae bacterium]